MERHGFACKVKEGKKTEFRAFLGKHWEQITKILDGNALGNFSLWNADHMVFGYYESPDHAEIREEDSSLLEEMICQAEESVEWISKPGETMRLMYHNYGVVRENKELIRIRMFMTKLHEGCAEEYKRRHDGLIEQRAGRIDPGPDSNFSIFSAGGYIFGYDEIDTSMEVTETEEAHAATVAWETRQLEIMDWITNDVDWMTGEVHADCVQIASHR